ncbi:MULTISPECIES: replication initiation protein [Pseudomonas]|uniref:Replication initiation protein n=1 Tax=Pseudomonas nitroreducens TaxID=46680 RepID=A0A6G6J6Y1_PSENT|nr:MULTISPECIES: replication initiation protein [Pseudomonas]MBD9634557.1 replication initiation protein [Pseudomonas sp. PDM19]MCG8911039.1 replication initiation protein [Pseudomonas sp. DP-17]QIE91176.1 replication initiation protein [Pseudomonas nitroreducens]UCL90230.1 replication initiation protein [Pseudomonas sp. HS-18]
MTANIEQEQPGSKSKDKDQRPLRVSKSNDLIQASYKLTLQEQRLVLAAICKQDPRKPMEKVISVYASDFAKIYGIPLRHCYEYMKEAADSLYERDIKTYDNKGMDRKRWVDRAKYVTGEGRVDLYFTVHVMPYLSHLTKRVTTYDLRRVAQLESTNSYRLFEMLMQFRSTGWAHIEVDRLREALGLDGAYERFNNLRQRVIDPAVKELEAKSGLIVTYELQKAGRKVKAIKFAFKDAVQMPLVLPDQPEFIPGSWDSDTPLSDAFGELLNEDHEMADAEMH